MATPSGPPASPVALVSVDALIFPVLYVTLYYSTVCTEITIQSLKRQTYYLLYNVITTTVYITPVFRELDAQCTGR